MLLSEAINQGLECALQDTSTLLCGQLVRHGHSSLTRGLETKYASQVITFPVSEKLMNSCALGLSLAGKKPIILHERFDFAVVGMQALLQAKAWRKLGIKLPLIVVAIVGHGKGQGPEQANDYREWFREMEGWEVQDKPPYTFEFKETPRMLVIPRQLYD